MKTLQQPLAVGGHGLGAAHTEHGIYRRAWPGTVWERKRESTPIFLFLALYLPFLLDNWCHLKSLDTPLLEENLIPIVTLYPVKAFLSQRKSVLFYT